MSTQTNIRTRQRQVDTDQTILILIGIWLLANSLNVLTTTMGFNQGFVEISPIPRWFLLRGGLASMWTLKLLASLLLPTALWSGISNGVISRKGARMGLIVASLAVIIVVAREMWLLGIFG